MRCVCLYMYYIVCSTTLHNPYWDLATSCTARVCEPCHQHMARSSLLQHAELHPPSSEQSHPLTSMPYVLCLLSAAARGSHC